MNYGIIVSGVDNMYIRLSKSESTKDYIVYLVEGYRSKDGKTKQRTLKSFGYLSELTKDNPNALEELKEWAKEETKKIKQEKKLTRRRKNRIGKQFYFPRPLCA